MRFRLSGTLMGGATLPVGWECELNIGSRGRCGRIGAVFANLVDLQGNRSHPWVCHECASFLAFDTKQQELRKTAGA